MGLIWSPGYYVPGWRIGIDTGVTTDFSLITYGTCNFDVNWGDGSTETVDNVGPTTTFTTTHNYSTPGTYTVEIDLNSGDFFPYYNSDAAGDELVTLGDTPAGWSFGTTLQHAFRGSGNLITVGDIDTSSVTSFNNTWQGCYRLTSFPFINTSLGTDFTQSWADCTGLNSFPVIDTSSGTNFSYTWNNCRGLTSFPLIDTSGGTTFISAWKDCRSIDNISALGEQYSFPQIVTSSATSFQAAWQGCISLTSFPLLDASKVSTFYGAWVGCSSLADFPANMFDTTGALSSASFGTTWSGCALTAQSIENILVSLQTNQAVSGKTGVTVSLDGGTNAAKSTWSAAANTAYDDLVAASWVINHNP